MRCARSDRRRFLINRPAQGGARKKARGIKRWQRRIRVVHDQGNFGTTEYDGVAALLIFHPSDDALKKATASGLNTP